MDGVYSIGGTGLFDRYLSFSEREETFGGLAEQLEQYLADLSEIEGLSEELYDETWALTELGEKNTLYFTQIGAYMFLAETYLRMGNLEECLRVRTEWAAFCDRPDLVQDGNHGYYELEFEECDRYGRTINYYLEERGERSVMIYGEPHDGATHWHGIEERLGYQLEDDYTYDSEGRILHWHRVITDDTLGVRTVDYEYVYTGNNSFVMTMIDSTGQRTQYEEQFYDKYGREIDY